MMIASISRVVAVALAPATISGVFPTVVIDTRATEVRAIKEV